MSRSPRRSFWISLAVSLVILGLLVTTDWSSGTPLQWALRIVLAVAFLLNVWAARSAWRAMRSR